MGRTEEESTHGQHHENALGSATAVRPCAERGKYDQDDGRGRHGKLPRIVVGDPAKHQLTDHGAGEGDRGDILRGVRAGVFFGVDDGEHGVDIADDLRVSVSPPNHAPQNRTSTTARKHKTYPVQIPVRVQSSATRKHRPQALPFRLLGRRRARRVVGVNDVSAGDDRVLGGFEEIGHYFLREGAS